MGTWEPPVHGEKDAGGVLLTRKVTPQLSARASGEKVLVDGNWTGNDFLSEQGLRDPRGPDLCPTECSSSSPPRPLNGVPELGELPEEGGVAKAAGSTVEGLGASGQRLGKSSQVWPLLGWVGLPSGWGQQRGKVASGVQDPGENGGGLLCLGGSLGASHLVGSSR